MSTWGVVVIPAFLPASRGALLKGRQASALFRGGVPFPHAPEGVGLGPEGPHLQRATSCLGGCYLLARRPSAARPQGRRRFRRTVSHDPPTAIHPHAVEEPGAAESVDDHRVRLPERPEPGVGEGAAEDLQVAVALAPAARALVQAAEGHQRRPVAVVAQYVVAGG